MKLGPPMIHAKPVSRRAVISAGAAATTLLSLHDFARAQPEDGLSFQAIGDWGSGNEMQRRVAGAMAAVAQTRGCDFLISTGDNFYPKGVAHAADEKFKTHFEEPYSAASLGVPWNVVLGNHDHDGNPRAQIEYSAMNPRWRLPANYYKRTEKLDNSIEVDFFYLDTDPIHSEHKSWSRFIYFPSRGQIEWLERALAASRAQWKIVVGHHPVYSGGRHGNTRALIDLLTPIFRRHGVQIYLNGHNHNLEHVVVDDVHYLTSGGGSHPRPVKPIEGMRFAAGKAGFMWGRLSAQEMSVEFFDDAAQSLYRAAIPVGL